MGAGDAIRSLGPDMSPPSEVYASRITLSGFQSTKVGKQHPTLKNRFPSCGERIHLLIKIDVQHFAAVAGKTSCMQKGGVRFHRPNRLSKARYSKIIAKKQRAARFDQSHTR